MKIGITVLMLLVTAVATCYLYRNPHVRHATILTQDAYIWQRSWTPAVDDSVLAQAAQFRTLVVLAAEISLRDDNRVVEIDPTIKLISSIHSIGLAVRIGPLPTARASAFDARSPETKLIEATCVNTIARAHRAGVNVTELQIDFDCADSKLAKYCQWVSAVQAKVRPLPVHITALPSWLNHREFRSLAKTAGAFVLQVHSLHAPSGPTDPMILCDPDEARRAVALASEVGVPFRVALPTYGYVAGFSSGGKLLGLSAEGEAPSWPADAVVEEMDSDPVQLTALVREWTAIRPKNMTGLIWYRLPVTGDRLNWSSVTLKSVMNRVTPSAALRVTVAHPESGLTDVFLENVGSATAVSRSDVSITFGSATELAAEGIDSFDCLEQEAGKVIFHDTLTGKRRIAPGEHIQIGWLRFNTDTEVHTHVIESPH